MCVLISIQCSLQNLHHSFYILGPHIISNYHQYLIYTLHYKDPYRIKVEKSSCCSYYNSKASLMINPYPLYSYYKKTGNLHYTTHNLYQCKRHKPLPRLNRNLKYSHRRLNIRHRLNNFNFNSILRSHLEKSPNYTLRTGLYQHSTLSIM